MDKIGKFERTQNEEVSLAHGEQVSLGLDNVVIKDGIATNLYKEISFPTSAKKTESVAFSNAHELRLDGSEATQTSPNGKALQLNHYVPIEVDRLKAQVTQDNVVSLLGANEIPDNHVYSEKVRQNTLRGVTVEQGEHYKVDLSSVDPENASVERSSSAADSIHVEGSSKTKQAAPAAKKGGAGFLKLSAGKPAAPTAAPAPRTSYTQRAGPRGPTTGSGSSYISSQMSQQPRSSRAGFLRVGGA